MQNINKTGLVDKALTYLSVNDSTAFSRFGKVLYTAEIKQDVKTLNALNYAYLSSGAVHFVTLIVSGTEVRNGIIAKYTASKYCFISIDSNGYRSWDMGTVASATDTPTLTDSGETGSVNDLKEHYSLISSAPVGGGSAVSNVAFDNAKPALTTLKIVDKEGNATSYKAVPCGNASGASSIASGPYSTASGASSIASGPYSTASGPYSAASGESSIASGGFSIASGYGSTASGPYSIASGDSSIASGASSVAIGHGAISNIARWVSFDGNNSTNTEPQNDYITASSPDYFLFRNADVNYNATSAANYADLKTLTDYLGTGAPAIVTTETIEGMIAGTSADFDVSGAGTSGDPYVVTPKTDLAHPHSRRVYQVDVTVAPTANKYVRFKSSGTERCFIRFTLNAAGTYGYLLNFQNLYGWVRSRNINNSESFSSSDINTASATGKTLVDINGSSMFATYPL